MQEKELGLATLILLNIILFNMASQTMGDIAFYAQTALLLFYVFQGGVFFMTLIEKNPSTSIPGITFLIMLVNTLFIAKTGYLLFTFMISIIGIAIASLKFYKKHIRKMVKKKDILNRELDDSWDEEPHIIYE